MQTKSEWTADVIAEIKDTEDWTDDEGEVRELSGEDIARMKPFSSLPTDLQEKLRSLKKNGVQAS